MEDQHETVLALDKYTGEEVYEGPTGNEASIVENLPKFRYLHFLTYRDTRVTHLPESLIDVEKLESIKLFDNVNLEVIPQCVAHLPRLRKFQAIRCGLRSFPSFEGSECPLVDFVIIDCKLDFFPDRIDCLQQLRNLCLRNNHICDLPEQLAPMKELESIDMSDNSISKLPRGFIGNVPNLIRLSLQNNQLFEIVADIGLLSDLETLELQGNQIVSIPPSICKLQQLVHFHLEYNQIKEPPLVELAAMRRLQRLHLEGNPLRDRIFECNEESKRVARSQDSRNPKSLELLEMIEQYYCNYDGSD